jgi:hypothetical protein
VNQLACTVTVNVLASAAGRITAAASIGTVHGTDMLKIVRLNIG